ncbi:hypothetical protein GSU10_05800 [Rathayibacter tanaceti]|uniref:Uncharacterized protein n=1 Tax=Rathayibacter tanaceti TaxID=1671680 RepID=A0AAE6V7H8_9MICO|nr:hypothetical protein GSU10_05800 [Rathayibacter tanaceti]
MQSASWTGVVLVLLAGLIGAVLAVRLRRPQLAWIGLGSTGAAFLLTAIAGVSAPPAHTVLVAVLAFALAVVGGGPVVLLTLDLATADARTGRHGGIMVAGASRPSTSGTPTAVGQPIEVLRGGTTIGVLERITTAGALMSGLPEGIAVVVAIKGVGRFSELASPEARERFIIGTLASLAWSAALGVLARLYLVG